MARANKFIFWTPRILAIVFILFLAMFSLDIFDGNYGFWGTVAGLFMHNIPVFILAIILVISWKHEIIGAVAFILAGVLYIAGLLMTILMNSPHQWFMLAWSVTVAGPAFFVGILFLIGWLQKRKTKKKR